MTQAGCAADANTGLIVTTGLTNKGGPAMQLNANQLAASKFKNGIASVVAVPG
jgi:hypothetical protein